MTPWGRKSVTRMNRRPRKKSQYSGTACVNQLFAPLTTNAPTMGPISVPRPPTAAQMAIWAAVGGRGTLVGPILGAFFVNGAKSWFTQAFPEFWLYFLGALFIAVTLFLPQGIIGLLRRAKKETKA